MAFKRFFRKTSKPKRWICSCQRINGPDDKVCLFCKQPKPDKPVVKKKRAKAYDDLHLWPIFSLYIRLRDSNNDGIGRCFTCGTPKHYTRADCGHGLPRQHKKTKYSLQNNHLQCKHCNGFKGGMREKYMAEMDKRYGAGTWERMEIEAHKHHTIDKFWVDLMVKQYTEEVEILKIGKGL